MNQLTGKRFGKSLSTNNEEKKACLVAVRARVAKDCAQQKNATGFFRLYEELFELDTVMTAALACELRLVNRLVDDKEARPSVKKPDRRANTVEIPEWHTLFCRADHIERSALYRHVMISGEAGYGKTQSAILPVLKAIPRQADRSYQGTSPLSCALVIDPKTEILPILQKEAPDGVAVRVLKTRRYSRARLEPNLMVGE